MMLDRIDYQLTAVRKVLRKLGKLHVQVKDITISSALQYPVIRVSEGPFTWTCEAYGRDEAGHWQDWTAHESGVVLRRRTRAASPDAYLRGRALAHERKVRHA